MAIVQSRVSFRGAGRHSALELFLPCLESYNTSIGAVLIINFGHCLKIMSEQTLVCMIGHLTNLTGQMSDVQRYNYH